MYKDGQNKNLKQNKVQGKYRKIKQQIREDNNDKNKIGAVIVSIFLFILLLLYVLNAIFDL
jgi:hypothetical protein